MISNNPVTNPIITIDGPSGVGKGTLAKRLAARLDLPLLDSGALYRVIGYLAAQNGVDFADERALTQLTKSTKIEFLLEIGKQYLWINGEKLTANIRTETVGDYASRVAQFDGVRTALLYVQRKMAAHGLVADGRDMGTVIFPNAHAKLFLTANAEARAARRTEQLAQKGEAVDLAQVLAELRARDDKDTNRAIAPLKAAADALILDSSHLTIDAVEHAAVDFLRKKGIL